MSHGVLIRPPAIFSRFAYTSVVTPPLALAYLSANLRTNGHQVTAIDALGLALDQVHETDSSEILYRGLSNKEIVNRIPRSAEWIGISAMFSQDWPHVRSIIQEIHKVYPEIPIIVGGEHATATSEFILETTPEVLAIAKGEGEETIVDFATFAEGKSFLADVNGIIWRSEDTLIANSPRARKTDIDNLPWPAWDLFDLDKYFYGAKNLDTMSIGAQRDLPIMATRGCPYCCSFCSSPNMWTTRYVMRSVEKVVDEIEFYKNKYGVKLIEFYDLTMTTNQRWILDFTRELQKRKLEIQWQMPNGTRSEILQSEVLTEMAKAGCTAIHYAPESGSQRTLNNIRKQANLIKLLDSMKIAERLGLDVKCNFILGFPKETRADIWSTIRFAMKVARLGVEDVNLFLYCPYPGSELFDYLKRNGKIKEMDSDYFASLTCLYDFKTSSNYCENVGPYELWFLRHLSHLLFYLTFYLSHPSRILVAFHSFFSNSPNSKFETRIFREIRNRLKSRHRPPRTLLEPSF